MKKVRNILISFIMLFFLTTLCAKPSFADTKSIISLRVINDTVLIEDVPKAKTNDDVSVDFYYEMNGEYEPIGGIGFAKSSLSKNHVYLTKNGNYMVEVAVNNKIIGEKYFQVTSIKKASKNPDIYTYKEQIMCGMSPQYKGIYTISPLNPPENRSIVMRMYTIKDNKFKLKYTQKLSPYQEMEIPRLKGVREYAFTYSVDGKESDYHVYLLDKNYKYYEDDFIVKNYDPNKKDPKEKVVKTKAELKKFVSNVLSKKKDEFVTIKNKNLEKYCKNNGFSNSLLKELYPNKKEREKYAKILKKYHCYVSYSKKYNAKEIHLFPMKTYYIDN